MNGYLKFASMVWIRALRQPILDGVIVKHWSDAAGRAVKDFCDRHGSDDVLLRIDNLNARWSQRRGGYIIPRSKARATAVELNNEGRIAAFLEPVSPYRDRYSLAAITDDTAESMTVEVVGPGFDASDLLRSDSTPHERFEALIGSPQKRAFARRIYIVRSEDYRRSVGERLIKIGARLRNPAYPKTIIDSVDTRGMALAEEAVRYLKRTKQTTLLGHAEAYEPIPKRFLEKFVDGVGRITDGLKRYRIRLGLTSFSATFTTRGRFTFWDFFPADLTKGKKLYLGSNSE